VISLNIYDWKMMNIFLIIFGFAMMLTVWAYHLSFNIPNMVTNMLSGIIGGLMILGTILCRVRIIQIYRFYENGDDKE